MAGTGRTRRGQTSTRVRWLASAAVACSAATAVALPAAAQEADTIRPGAPQFVESGLRDQGTIQLTWFRSTDNVGVTSYTVYRNGEAWLTTPDARRSVIIDDFPAGTSLIQVDASDAAGNRSARSAPIPVIVDRRGPRAVQDLAGSYSPGDGMTTLTFTAPGDPAGLAGLQVRSNGTVIADMGVDQLVEVDGLVTMEVDLDDRSNFLQVQTADSVGNLSVRSAPSLLTIPPADVWAPGAPGNFVARSGERGFDITLEWTTPFEGSELAFYEILDLGIVVDRIPAGEPIYAWEPNRPGLHWVQMRAVDSSGNRSVRTPPELIDVFERDTPFPVSALASQSGDAPAVGFDGLDPIVTVDWIGSTAGDGSSLAGYEISNGESVLAFTTETTVDLRDLPPTTSSVTVTAIDDAGRRSAPRSVSVDVSAIAPPKAPIAVVSVDGAQSLIQWSPTIVPTFGAPVVGYRLIGDDVGVDDRVFEPLGDPATAGAFGLGVALRPLATGTYVVQLVAVDARGLESAPSAPIEIRITNGI